MYTSEDQIWKERISGSNTYYEKWEKRFKCDTLEEYYEGFQWKGDKAGEKYVINKIMETIHIKIDSFIPDLPTFLINSSAGNSDYNLEAAALSASLKQDVLNTLIQNPESMFSEEMGMAFKDSFFRFGIIEVGYSADWILNPNAPKPLLNTDQDKDAGKPRIKNVPKELPVNERVYFKHIPAKTFRVGGIDHKYLHRCSWFGYYEWVDKNDLLALPSLKNRKKLENCLSDNSSDYYTSDKNKPKETDAIKIWHIWDNKARTRLILLDSPSIIVSEKPFDRVNIFDYRPDKSLITNGFYPIPPVHHWISPQNEINETREQNRNHRRRFNRKFQIMEQMIDDEELEKFEHGEDGALITVKRDDAIKPIQSANLGPETDKAVMLASDDLNQISGTSAEVRGVADRTTATQANIISQRSSIRENAERSRVTKWFCKIGREALLIARDKFTLGIWAMLTQDPGEQILGTVQSNQGTYAWVTSEDLNDTYDFKVTVDLTTMSAASQELEKRKFLEFISIVAQFPQIGLSPTLIREAATRCGYRNEKVIKEMQQMAMLNMYGMMAELQMNPGNTAQNVNNANTPNDSIQIRNQLENQLGVTQ